MTTDNIARIIFAGGGTGGHLFPALAIANRVKELLQNKMKTEIIFVGTKRGIEYRMRESLGYPLYLINMRGIARTLTFKNLLVPFVVIGALIKAVLLLNRFRPDIVFGTGGYVCWPVLKVASWKNITTLLQEQNSYPGVTTRQLAPKTDTIYLGFEVAKKYLKTKAEIVVSGNPVRDTITEGERKTALEKFGLDPNRKTILILGGSQGAHAINEAILRSLEKDLLSDKYQILWQTGKRDYKEVAKMAGAKVSNCALFPFLQNMEIAYASADMVIARAGASTLAEITACGLPSILIPYPYAAGDHQKKNAQDYVARKMAVMIEEKDLSEVNIFKEALKLLESDQYALMKEAIRKETANKKKAVDIIAEDVIRKIESIHRIGV